MNRLLTIALSVALGACGAQAGDDAQASTAAARGGGTPAAAPAVNPLPSAPPSPDMVIRESFGLGPSFVRPAGGKGDLRATAGDLDGFWVEWPGSGTAWHAAQGGWSWAGCSDDPYQLPSPLETLGNACTVSSWADGVVRFPDAIVPFGGLAGAYELSADVVPAALQGASVAIGFTASGALTANLQAAGQVWLLVRYAPQLDGTSATWELRAGDAAAGLLLAAGTTLVSGWTPLSLRYDPATQTVTASVNGVAVGPFPAGGVAPRFVAIEGQGVADNLVVRAVP